MRILVGYASVHGSTREIAERIAERLRGRGHSVEVCALSDTGDAGAYDAAVLGSAVHNGAWLPHADEYVQRNSRALAEQPVWLFSVGMARAVGGWFEAHAQEPKEIPGIRVGIHSRDHRLFNGVLERGHLPLPGRLAYRLMRGRYGDFRNWSEIDAWADGIAAGLPTGTGEGPPG